MTAELSEFYVQYTLSILWKESLLRCVAMAFRAFEHQMDIVQATKGSSGRSAVKWRNVEKKLSE
jgi:hypothetical protein